MVLKKRLDYGFNGFQVPVIPKGPRSLRKRDSFKKEKGDGQICAFELLAAVAGKLLQECESSSASSNNSDQLVAGNDAIKLEQVDDESTIVSEHSSPGHNKYNPKGFLNGGGDVVLERTSCGKVPSKAEAGSPDLEKSYGGKIENGIEKEHKGHGESGGGLTVTNIGCVRDSMGFGSKKSALVKSESKGELLKCRNPVSNDAFRKHTKDGNVSIKDDNENSYRRSDTKLRSYRPYRPSQRIGDRRIRKILTSKYWKAAPKLMEYDCRSTDKGVYRSRKTYFSRDNFQNDRPFKKRKLFDVDYGSVVTSGGGVGSETHSNSPEKDMNGNKSDSDDLLCAEKGLPSSVRGHRDPYHSRDSHVRLSIKSFRVPELFIELPENATVGYLKRTVMEAVEAMLHGGLDVGVLLKGKKVKDDSRTLFQTGISHNYNLDTLGFTLEPDSPASSPLATRDLPLLQSCDTPLPLSRLPVSKLDSGDSDASYNPSPLANLGMLVDTGHELALSPTDILTEKTVPESRALVPVPAKNVEALAMVPMSQKNRRSELVQRRTRRPFSVSEVEALVHAVEKLGTGRWRDVKYRAFDNANHRTYVDLKDKWKTLVHTAQISPQQRRGEPVPQDLLDRVLAAHSHWSHHQAKHQGKP